MNAGSSAVVALDLPADVREDAMTGLRTSMRGGLRVSLHLYNTRDDVDRLIGHLTP
jgi:selenocysteine lyase/cysteine desulfurase